MQLGIVYLCAVAVLFVFAAICFFLNSRKKKSDTFLLGPGDGSDDLADDSTIEEL